LYANYARICPTLRRRHGRCLYARAYCYVTPPPPRKNRANYLNQNGQTPSVATGQTRVKKLYLEFFIGSGYLGNLQDLGKNTFKFAENIFFSFFIKIKAIPFDLKGVPGGLKGMQFPSRGNIPIHHLFNHFSTIGGFYGWRLVT
jgi:hypothetical protein